MEFPEQIRSQSEAVEQFYKDQSEETLETTTDAEQGEYTVASENEHEDAESGKSAEYFEQKYRTLQGMYNAEVPRLHTQVREQSQRMQQMEQLLASLSGNQQKAQSQPAQERYLSEQDVEDYGESIDVMRKVAREELTAVAQRIAQIESMVNQFNSQLVPQVNSVVQQQQMTSEQAFWSNLTAAVPNWREVNSDKNFQNWLLQADPLTGLSRQTYLEDAQRALDARRVAAFFRTWLESNQAPVAQTTNGTLSQLEKQVSPGRSKNSGHPQSNKAKVYTPKDIERFFEDVRKGKYKGREDERARIERDIFAAQRENRIQVA